MEPNLAGSIYVRSFMKFVHYVPFGKQTSLPWTIFKSDWLNFHKSPLKLLGQMEPNYIGSIYGRSFIKCVQFVVIGQQTWPPWAILNSDLLSFLKCSLKTTCPNGTKLGRKHRSMRDPLWRLLILSHSENKHGRHGQFLILIGWILKNLLWNYLAK